MTFSAMIKALTSLHGIKMVIFVLKMKEAPLLIINWTGKKMKMQFSYDSRK
jgi:hypothetical protein